VPKTTTHIELSRTVERVLRNLEGVSRCIMWKRVRNRCGNGYLTKEITKESEMADTKSSTATGAPL
jgi:hypothetical protein